METIPARRGKAAYVKQGQSIRIVNTLGSQVVDTWAFTAGMLTEFMSMEHTRATLTKLVPRVGDGLYTNRRRKILTMTEDSSRGDHDTLMALSPTQPVSDSARLLLHPAASVAGVAGRAPGGAAAGRLGQRDRDPPGGRPRPARRGPHGSLDPAAQPGRRAIVERRAGRPRVHRRGSQL